MMTKFSQTAEDVVKLESGPNGFVVVQKDSELNFLIGPGDRKAVKVVEVSADV